MKGCHSLQIRTVNHRILKNMLFDKVEETK